MNYPVRDDIMQNFDLSIILPFYKKLNAFKRVLPINAPYFSRPGIEVIITMDEPSESKALIEYIGSYSAIYWKVYVNDQPHTWRPPCKAQNVGIRNSSKRYILLLDPESEFFNDVIYQLLYMCKCYEKCFTTGEVTFADFNCTIKKSDKIELLPYGSILVEKKYLWEVNGYDESYLRWGGDDDNIRSRLQYYGLDNIHVNSALLVHREQDNRQGHMSRYVKGQQNSAEVLKRSYLPNHYFANDENWGLDFSKLIYTNG